MRRCSWRRTGTESMAAEKVILWEVGCEGLKDAWVVAPDWPQATVAAAEQWGVPWRQVAAACFEKHRIENPKRNICARCKRVYAGHLPLCSLCEKEERLEHERMRRMWTRIYRRGVV